MLTPWVWCCRLLATFMLLAGLWMLPRLEINTDLLALFPQQNHSAAEQQAERQLSQSFANQALLLVGADDNRAVVERLPQVITRLQDCPCIKTPQLGLGAEGDHFSDLYSDNAPIFLTDAWRQKLQNQSLESLRRSTLRDVLTRPGGINRDALANDPLQTLAAFKRRALAAPEALQIDGAGFPYINLEQQKFYVLRIELAASPYSVATQTQFAQVLAKAFAPLRDLSGYQRLDTGAIFYTLSGTAQARAEVSTVGLGSAVGIVVLLLLVFRQLSVLPLAFAPIAAGVVAGLAMTQWVFGQVHIMALVFGAALVGVAIDYSLHFFSKRFAAGKRWRSDEGLRQLIAPLTLGVLSSGAGYLSFTASGFPGFVQIAVLSGSGLVVAYAVVIGFYPKLLSRPAGFSLGPVLSKWIAQISRLQLGLLSKLTAPALTIVVVLLLGVGASVWQVNDDIRQMQRADPQLQAMDQRVRGALAVQPALPYLLVQASSAETLLQRLEALQPQLDAGVQAGYMHSYRSLAKLLPSGERQRRNAEIWQDRVIDSGLLASMYETLGVKSAAQSGFIASLSSPVFIDVDAELSRYAQLPSAPGYFVNRGKHYGVISLYGLQDGAALSAFAATVPGVRWVDPVTRTNQLLREYRERASVLLLGAYAVILVLLWSRYGVRGAVRVVLPAALASGIALTAVLFLGQAISVFHIMALLLVLGIGMDYALFWRESAARSQATFLAVGLSTATTVLSFGLLSLSATAAIHNFGLVVLVGIVLAFALAPWAQKIRE
ncbi:MMPL family transporter [Gilvimarinus xylanilyticus]|uniref:Membrane transport protein MMPL domain-containing protein n=1 Tax=Gilvimarinus xylanilyticus TaxID=2944139 RepID=A0A9X2I531_9GAMM|nr:hypothetical protein [Gilvimarinus xylanilyticus]MCP8900126.1 hypothetical protein [Gilvimarinus xylanilyticus]